MVLGLPELDPEEATDEGLEDLDETAGEVIKKCVATVTFTGNDPFLYADLWLMGMTWQDMKSMCMGQRLLIKT